MVKRRKVTAKRAWRIILRRISSNGLNCPYLCTQISRLREGNRISRKVKEEMTSQLFLFRPKFKDSFGFSWWPEQFVYPDNCMEPHSNPLAFKERQVAVAFILAVFHGDK
jgi:hypothetical protein